MKEEFAAQRLTVYIGEDDIWHGGRLYAAIVERLKEAEVAGVTVLHGIEGYGARRKVHTERIEVLFQGLPILVEAVDAPERIQSALLLLDGMLAEALVTVEELRAIRYRQG